MQTEEEKNSAIVRNEMRKRLRKHFRETFKPMGFTSNSTGQCWNRESKTLRQSCLFLFPRTLYVRIQVQYTMLPCYDCWEDVPQDPQTQLTLSRFKESWRDDASSAIHYSEMKDWDTPSTVEEIDAVLSDMDDYIKQKALPFLDRYQESFDALRDYDQGLVGVEHICSSPGWFDFNLAVLRYQEKKYEEAFEYFQNFLAIFDEDIKSGRDTFEQFGAAVELAVEALEKRLNRKNTIKERIEQRAKQKRQEREPFIRIVSGGGESTRVLVGFPSDFAKLSREELQNVLIKALKGEQSDSGE